VRSLDRFWNDAGLFSSVVCSPTAPEKTAFEALEESRGFLIPRITAAAFPTSERRNAIAFRCVENQKPAVMEDALRFDVGVQIRRPVSVSQVSHPAIRSGSLNVS
jgi:hypothetical protein